MSLVSKNGQVDDIIRCGKDPIYFINKYAKITHASKGLIQFKTFKYQNDCINSFVKHRFNIVLKSRQLGLSTITAAYALWKAIFYKSKNILIIATKMSVAANFMRIVKTILSNLPPWLIISRILSETRTSIEFSNGSIIKAVPTSEDAGRSEALSLLIVDEAAFIRNFEELWKGLYSTLSTGGAAIVLSTPNGVGNQYHKLWVDAENKISDFNTIKLMWDVHPERDKAWFEKETRQMTRKQIAQELMCDFASSGNAFLNNEDLERLRMNTRSPIERWGPDNGIWLWKYPIPDRKYIIAADVARGDANDFSTFHVIDTQESEQVCEFRGKLPPDQFGVLLNEIGLRYNKALLCPENNTYGYSTITKLRDILYPNLHLNDKRYQYSVEIPTSKFGFSTQTTSRATALTKLEEYLRTGAIKIYSARLIDEIKTFVWVGDTPRAQKGFFDDLVMALAIAGTLFDPTLGPENTTSTALYKGLLSGFGVNKQKEDIHPILFGEKLRIDEQGSTINSAIPPEILWLYK